MKRFTGFAIMLAALSCQDLDDHSDAVDDRGNTSVDDPDGTNGSSAGAENTPSGEVPGPGAGGGATPEAEMTEDTPSTSSGDADDSGAEASPGSDDGDGDGDGDASTAPEMGAGGSGAVEPPLDDGNGSPAPDAGSGGTSSLGGTSNAGGTPSVGGTLNAGGTPSRGGASNAGGAKPIGGAPNVAGTKNGGAANTAGSPPATAGAPGSAGAPSQCTSVVTEHGVTGAEHITPCSAMTYETNPPCEGNHYDSAAAFTTYDEPIPHGFVVHSLEHGGIAVWYNCPGGCPAEVARAQAWIDALPEDVLCVGDGIPRRILMVPNPQLPTRWAASAWGWTLTAPCFDEAALTSFYRKHYGKTSEIYCRGSQITSKTCPRLK